MNTTSWAESESQRHPDGQCRPSNGQPIASTACSIAKGTLVEFRRVRETAWRRHVMSRVLCFERYVGLENRRYLFRAGSFEFRVHRKFVAVENNRDECDT